MASLELTMEEINKMKVADLKAELKNRGLPTNGAKSELVSRLTAATQSQNEAPEETKETTEEEVEEEITLAEESESDALLEVDKKDHTEKQTENVAPKTATSLRESTETEKLKMRAEKFGVINEDLKKLARAERFGLSQQSNNTSGKISMNAATDIDKLKKRAERFGTVVSSTLSKVDSADKLKQRAERFGTSTTSTTSPLSKSDEQSKLLKRKERFGAVTISGNDDVEAKKRKRAERFGLT